jgi:colicin import membrane protein
VDLDEKVCKYPGCENPAAMAMGPGRAPEYCDEPGHNRSSAYQERRRLAMERSDELGEAPELTRPVTLAGARMETNIERFVVTAAQLHELGERVLADLGVVRDPAALAAEITTVRAESNAAVATAEARAVEAANTARAAVAARTQAEAERGAADARARAVEGLLRDAEQTLAEAQQAVEASNVATSTAQEQASTAREQAGAAAERASHAEERADAAERVAGELVVERDGVRTELNAAQATSDTLRADLATVTTRAAQAQAAADQALRAAEADLGRAREQAVRDASLRERAEAERDAGAAAHQQTQAELVALRRELAAAVAERDEARHSLAAERVRAAERLADLRAHHDERLGELRTERDAAQATSRAAERQVDVLTAQLAAAQREPATAADGA